MEVCDIVQETGIKTIPKRKKCKKARWLSEEALQIAVKRREAKRRKGKIYPFECRVPKNSKEIRKPSSAINAKKERKTIEWEKVETVTDFIFLAPKSLHMVTVAMKLKDTCFLEGKL